MRVDILVRKQRVLHDASALCAYVARKLGNEQASFTDSDSEATEQIWDAGVASMEAAAKEWLRCDGIQHRTSGDWHGVLDMPENFEMAVAGALEASLHQYMVQFVVWKWLEIHATDAAGEFATGAAAAMSSTVALLSARQRPEADVIDTESLIHDIRSKAFVVADLTGMDEGSGESRHQTADIGSGANLALLRRDLDLAWHEIEDLFFAFMDHDGNDGNDGRPGCCQHGWPGGVDYGTVDNSAPIAPMYELKLLLPAGVTESTVRYWRTLMHEYLVAYALASWFGIVNPDRQAKFLVDVDRLREQIRSSMTRRTQRVHRPGRPF